MIYLHTRFSISDSNGPLATAPIPKATENILTTAMCCFTFYKSVTFAVLYISQQRLWINDHINFMENK
jgi:hypothetical protein